MFDHLVGQRFALKETFVCLINRIELKTLLSDSAMVNKLPKHGFNNVSIWALHTCPVNCSQQSTRCGTKFRRSLRCCNHLTLEV